MKKIRTNIRDGQHPGRLGQMGYPHSKVDSRFRGNDNFEDVIPAKAGIHDKSGVKFLKKFEKPPFDPVCGGGPPKADLP